MNKVPLKFAGRIAELSDPNLTLVAFALPSEFAEFFASSLFAAEGFLEKSLLMKAAELDRHPTSIDSDLLSAASVLGASIARAKFYIKKNTTGTLQ